MPAAAGPAGASNPGRGGGLASGYRGSALLCLPQAQAQGEENHAVGRRGGNWAVGVAAFAGAARARPAGRPSSERASSLLPP